LARLAIFAALAWECRPALARLGAARRSRLGDATVWHGERGVVVIRTGMGPARAASAARSIAAAGGAELFVSTGCAGALDPSLRPGDLLVPEAVCLEGGEPIPVDAAARRAAVAAADDAALRAHAGHFFTSSRMLASLAERRTAARCGAIAVEMESAAVAAVAAEHGIPFVAIRSILDRADDELDLGGRFVDPTSGAVKPLALAAHVLRHPSSLGRLMEMQRMMQASEAALARFFRAYVPC
jgi:adenosylhomocysteine nucleosidase